jgi:predicted aconitase
MDICAAITGRVPKAGLHLKENRKGQILLRLVDVAPRLQEDESFYVALGHLMGNLVQDKVPVIEGLPVGATDDQLKALGAAAASTGAVALFHAIGVTPEANTLEEALQGSNPERVIDVRSLDLRAAWSDLSTTAEGEKLDVVILGCPHFSFAEFQQLTQAIEDLGGGSRHPDCRILILTSQTSYSLLQRSEFVDPLTDFGVEIVLDTCMFHTPIIEPKTKVVMTNSGKCAYYAPGHLNVRVAFGSLHDCVRSAKKGVVCWEDSL